MRGAQPGGLDVQGQPTTRSIPGLAPTLPPGSSVKRQADRRAAQDAARARQAGPQQNVAPGGFSVPGGAGGSGGAPPPPGASGPDAQDDTPTKVGDEKTKGGRGRKESKNESNRPIFRLIVEQDPSGGPGIAAPTDPGTGLETGAEPAPGEEQPAKAREEDVVGDKLEGQTIQTADLTLSQNDALITLTFAGTKNPTTIQMKRNGVVVFNHEGQPYTFEPMGEPGGGEPSVDPAAQGQPQPAGQ